MKNDILTTDEAAEYLKVSKHQLVASAKSGNVPAQKVGRSWRFMKSALEDWFKTGTLNSFDPRAEASKILEQINGKT